jgi:circadian clock protein KaiC
MVIQRVPTGIPGFDELIEGGFLKNSTVLLSGGTGTGKTIFSMQYLINGAKKYNEPGVFLSFEEDYEGLSRDASRFGWDIDKLQKQKKVSFLYEEPYNLEQISKVIENAVYEYRAKRLVIDSTSVFGLSLETAHEVRMKLFDLIRLLKRLGVTSLVTSEILEDSHGLSRFGVEEFIADGVVVVSYDILGETVERTLLVRKMRSTTPADGAFSLEFGKSGIQILKR